MSTRTVRTDIDRLRDLDYPVHAAPAVHGGYRLVDAGADTRLTLAVYLCALGLDFDIPNAPELAEAVHRIATRCTRASGE